MQEFWIPVEFIPGHYAIPNTACAKLILPYHCPSCNNPIKIIKPGSNQIGGDLDSPCTHTKLYNDLWFIRITQQNPLTIKAASCTSSGGNCIKCNLFNEFQPGPYTCYYCRNRA